MLRHWALGQLAPVLQFPMRTALIRLPELQLSSLKAAKELPS